MGTSVFRGIQTGKEAKLETEKVLNKFKGTIDKKIAEKFIKTEYGRAIVKKAKTGVIRLTSDDLKADVIILRG